MSSRWRLKANEVRVDCAEIRRKPHLFALGGQLVDASLGERSRPKQLELETHVQGLKRTLASALGLNVAFKLTVADALGAIEMEPNAFEQIVVSLALNAKSATAGTGSLSIVARPLRIEASSYGEDRSALAAGSYVEVAISDDGPGIATSKLDTIFDPRFEGVDAGRVPSTLPPPMAVAGQAVHARSAIGSGH